MSKRSREAHKEWRLMMSDMRREHQRMHDEGRIAADAADRAELDALLDGARREHEAAHNRIWAAMCDWDRLAWHRNGGFDSPAEERALAATVEGKEALESAKHDPRLNQDPAYRHFFALAGIA